MILEERSHLKATLNTWQLWGIAVGLVISGEYFGWSYGWASAGTLGFLVVTVLVATMYAAFIFSFTELTTAIPHAGGPFAYAQRAFGNTGGYLAAAATLVEFVFAPPAIALAIGAYLHVQFPDLAPRNAAALACLAFMTINILGVHIAARFELVVTLLAIVELLVFMAVVAPGFRLITAPGMFAAVPFAIWLFLAIEGVAMAAEEVKSPSRSIPIAYIGGIATLLFLALGVMIFAGGVGDWKVLANINDPLPQAMKIIVGAKSGWLRMLVWLGLFGLVASLHGIILGYSRQIFALARAGYLPAFLGKIHTRFRTPYVAILAGGTVGIAAIYCDTWIHFSGQPLTANLVTMSALGALVMYIISMLALFHLRQTEPGMMRPFRTPLYPFLPIWTLLCAGICLVSLIYYNHLIAVLFTGLLAAGYLGLRLERYIYR